MIPLPNNFTVGDGLNAAGYRWIRRSIGSESNNGTGTNLNWNQFNLRIDHNFNANHKLSLVGSDRQLNGKTLTAMQRTHRIQTNGTFELPFGPNRRLLSSAPGFVQRIVERWQFGAIFSLSSGQPFSITANGSPYLSAGANYPNMLAEIPKSTGKVTATSTPGVITYFDGWKQVSDPGKLSLTTLQGLRGNNNNIAIQDASGKLILMNPALGAIGNMGLLWFEGPGSIGLDADIIKRVRITETKEFELRVDAINVLNHPNFGTPTTSINSTSFGRLALPTTGNRQFTFNLRLNF